MNKKNQVVRDKNNQDPYKDLYNVNGHKFEVDKRYQVSHMIGCGAYGIVCAAKLRKNNRKCAIKKVTKLFEDLVDGKRILREILLLRHFRHSNLLGMKDILTIQNVKEYKDIYFVTDLLDTDLYRVIRSNQALSMEHRQYFSYQILRGLKFMHSANVVHRDLKPSNILVNVNCNVKICDFGLARGINPEYPGISMTEYVVTRYYRAPEILLMDSGYNSSIDIWSFGCILAEMINRKPLFPGDNYAEQIKMIIRVLGKPSEEDSAHITHKDCVDFLNKVPNKQQGIPLRKLIPHANEMELDIIQRCLQFNPKKRPTCSQILKHPYFVKLHNEKNEPVCQNLFKFQYDYKDIDEKTLRMALYQLMLQYHPNQHKINQSLMQVN